MAEFQEVMKQWQRMCKNYKECENCPLNNILIICDDIPWIVSDIPEFEATIMKWAAEHPEPVYPTWVDWFRQMGVVEPTQKCFHDWLLKPIPADIAQKLGITPKESN